MRLKTFLKGVAWVVGVLIALAWWASLKDGEHDRVVIVAVVVWVFWSLNKTMDQSREGIEARLDRIEEMLQRQKDTGLTDHEIDGLVEIINDHRNAKRPAHQDG